MAYIPPHLRGKAGPTSGSTSNGTCWPDSGNVRSDEGDPQQRSASYARYDSLHDGPRRPTSTSRSLSARSARSMNRTETIEAVFPDWQPSERVLSFTKEQIDDIRQRLIVQVTVDSGQPDAVAPIETFSDMNLHSNILADIAHHRYDQPTPIQSQGIPIALSGRDVLGCAETGSGKTASFAIPMIQHCLHQPPLRPGDGPMGLVLAPTRELAQQIEKEVRAFSRSSATIRACIIVGGAQMSEQRHSLQVGAEVVVATPGRLNDHLQQGNTQLNRVSFVVLDEADRMLDMGFEPQIREVLSALPPCHQTLLFSATMPQEIEDLARSYLNNPVTCKIGKVSVPTANVAQHLERTTEQQKLDLLVGLLQAEMETAQQASASLPLTLVFVERKVKCDDVASGLTAEGIPAVPLHGGLTQVERESALREFSQGRCRVLVATDVASRGLDIRGIAHVINMDLPKTFEDYVHRIGRTGRAGSHGRATSFFTDRDSFLVAQIKSAIADLESGNGAAFQTGRAARQQEKQLAQRFKESMKLKSSGLVQTGGAAVKVDAKYAFMAQTNCEAKAGLADAAWDD